MAKEVKDAIPYDLQVLLPALQKSHSRISNGYFNPRTWNVLIDLFTRLPKNVRKKISLKDLTRSETPKELCTRFFLQMKEELEKQGYLRRITETEEGILTVE